MAPGKRSNRKPNRSATRKFAPAAPPVKVTIVADSAIVDGNLSLDREVALVKASILYADKVDLLSPGSDILIDWMRLRNANKQAVLRFMSKLDPSVFAESDDLSASKDWQGVLADIANLDDERLKIVENLMKSKSYEDFGITPWFYALLTEPVEKCRAAISRSLNTWGGDQIQKAIDQKLVSVQPLGVNWRSLDASVEDFAERIDTLLASGDVYPLLDGEAARMAQASINSGKLSTSALSIANAREATVGSGLIARLPAFSNVPIDEIVDLRTDISSALMRYRVAMSSLSSKLRVGPFDKDVDADIDHLMRVEVAPSLGQLHEELAQHGLIKDVAKNLSTDIKAVITGAAGPTVAIGAASLTDLNALLTIATASAPLGMMSAQAFLNELIKRRDRQSNAKQHGLFLLYNVERRLEK